MGLVALAGLFLAGILIAEQGVASVAGAVAAVGWGIVLVLLVHVVQVVISALGWKVISRRQPLSAPWTSFVLARWIREAVSNLLPMTQLGGEFVAARILTLRGMRGGSAGASVVIDLTMEVFSQILFTLLGVLPLLLGGYRGPLLEWTLISVAVALAVLLAFFAAQRLGAFHWLEALVARLARLWSLLNVASVAGLHDNIQALYRDWRSLIYGCALHLLSWLAGTGEVWLILHLLDTPVTWQQALVLESLGQGIRSLAFFVPAGLGIQEGGYLFLGTLFGLAPHTGLALSLVKRLRELMLGMPGLLAWRFFEGRGLLVTQVPIGKPTVES